MGCNLVADSQYCTPTNAYLIHLRLALYVPAANRQQQIKFVLFRAYGRDIRFQGRQSRFNANATAFWPLFTLPYNLIELAKGVPSENAGISYNLFRPVLMRRGDCIFWTACAEDEAEDLPSEALDYPKRRVASRCLLRRRVERIYTRSSEPMGSFQPIISRRELQNFRGFRV